MKNNIIVIVALFLGTTANAQTPLPSKKTRFNNAISMNPSTGIINGWYPTQYQQNEYLGMYHRIIGNANAIRIGLNGSANNSNSKTNDTITTNNKTNVYKIGIGYERYQYLTKAWNFYFGADAQFENVNSLSDNNQKINLGNNSKSQIKSIGTMAFIGVLVNFNSRISATIENGVTISREINNNEYEYLKNGVKTIQKSETSNNTVKYVNPQLHLRFRF